MSGLHLTVTTPLAVVLDEGEVASIRAEDESGGFGLMPGHADLLTVLRPSVLHWRRADGTWHHVALRGGVMRVAGDAVRVACREAVAGDDLDRLEALVVEQAAAQADAARRARGEQLRLHTAAIRNLMRKLGPGGGPEPEFDEIGEAFR